MTPAKKTSLKELQEIFHDTESANDKILKADPNTGRSMSLPHDIKMFVPNCRLYNEKKATTVQCILDHFSAK